MMYYDTIVCDNICQGLAASNVFSTYSDFLTNDITEVLLIVALNIKYLTIIYKLSLALHLVAGAWVAP